MISLPTAKKYIHMTEAEINCLDALQSWFFLNFGYDSTAIKPSDKCSDGLIYIRSIRVKSLVLIRKASLHFLVRLYGRFPENRLIFPVTAYNAVHDAVHAGVHELVQCRIFFQSNPSFRGVVAYLCFGGIASGKRKKPENHLVASDIF